MNTRTHINDKRSVLEIFFFTWGRKKTPSYEELKEPQTSRYTDVEKQFSYSVCSAQAPQQCD